MCVPLNPALNTYHALTIEDICPTFDNFDIKYTIMILFDELELPYIFFCVLHHLNRFSTVYNSSIINLSLIVGSVNRITVTERIKAPFLV